MSSTPRTSTDPHSVAGERADDEKTVREELESPDRTFSEKKDTEAAKDESISRAGSVAISPAEQDAGLDPDYDNFPDGGLKAWSVVVGVSVPLCALCYRSC